MNRHDVAHYSAIAALAGTLAWPNLPSSIGNLEFPTLPASKISLYCVEARFSVCETLEKRFRAIGWGVEVDHALSANKGIGLEGPKELADGLQKALGKPVKRTDPQGKWVVWVGFGGE